ncbi:MAG: hypothetical protein P8J93_01405 [SAR86 cluster bacterium]|nr:hypothetical protein [SAR86 cluster bacterium]
MQENKSILGKRVSSPDKYCPQILTPIKRYKLEKSKLSIHTKRNKSYGQDSFTCYELSWLKHSGIPSNGILYIDYPSESKAFIESKSLKLYLNSLNNYKSTRKELRKTIKSDLEDCLRCSINLRILNKPLLRKYPNSYKSINTLSINNIYSKVDRSILEADPTNQIKDHKLSCSLFRSLCPVTNQPDWATIFINYSGKLMSERSILEYLLSFREHKGFHEECAERIYQDVLYASNAVKLEVESRFLRRGGIEINSFRSNEKKFIYSPKKDLRQ